MKMIKLSALVVGTMALSSAAAAQTTWNMPVRSNPQNYMTQNIQKFADDIAERTDGNLQIELHPADSLVPQPDVLRAVRSQQVQVGEYLMSMHSNRSAMFAVDSIPFLASSYEANRRLARAARPAIKEQLSNSNVKLLFIQSWPRQGFYVDKEVKTLSDFDGVKMRAYNPNTARLAELMGATPVTVQQSEVPQAFSTGVVEAMITSPTTGIDTQAWDFVSHFYDVEAFITWNIVVVNQDVFENLEEGTREAVMAAAEQAGKRAWRNAPEVTEKQIATLEENGMTVSEPTEEMMAELREVGETMLREWLEKTGAQGEEIIERYRASGE